MNDRTAVVVRSFPVGQHTVTTTLIRRIPRSALSLLNDVPMRRCFGHLKEHLLHLAHCRM